MKECSILQGIIIGGAGGAIAAIMIAIIQGIRSWISFKRDSKKVYNFLIEDVKDKEDYRFRSTRSIASFTNLTIDRVRYVCSKHEKIHMSTGVEQDMWSTLTRGVDIDRDKPEIYIGTW